MTPEEIQRDLAFAVLAAREAGRRLLSLREENRWKDETLGDVGDQAADGFLRGMLLGRYPEDGVLSEETADTDERLEKQRCWIVDPLDGTAEYRELREDFGVHVALVVGGRCALGAVALPARRAVLYGVSIPGRERAGLDEDCAQGAALGGRGTELARGASAPPAGGLRIVHSRSHTPPWMERFAAEVGASSCAAWGSAGFKTCLCLLGEADVYVHKLGLKEWDTCAPEAVARALGWHVCKLRGEEHAYNRTNPRNHELVVCRPAHRDRVLAAVRRSGALD